MRLIDADALIEERAEEMWQDRCDHMVVRVTNIENAPTIDAVEVVRCKDCKYWVEERKLGTFCSHWAGMLSKSHGDDYCSCGVKIEGKEDRE